jgi:Fe-S-cluster-containing hydrogenase component 2
LSRIFRNHEEDDKMEEERQEQISELQEQLQQGKISRRDFLRGATLLGVSLGAAQALAACAAPTPEVIEKEVPVEVTRLVEAAPQEIVTEAPIEIPKAMGHIVQVSIDESACAGCGTCELVCSLVHEGAVGPSLRRLWLDRDPIGLVHHIVSCQQCDYPECYFACPLKDEAFCIDEATGVRYINTDKCTGCDQQCIKACPFDPPRINFDPERNVAVKCDLCKDREGGPACIEFCQAQALVLA